MRKILFVCADNAVLSPFAESYLNSKKIPDLKAFSAGPAPAVDFHALMRRYMTEQGLPCEGFVPKSWELFCFPQAPVPDVVVTLAATVQDYTQPSWPAMPQQLIWDFPDIADADLKMSDLRTICTDLRTSIDHALALGLFARADAKGRLNYSAENEAETALLKYSSMSRR